MKKLMAPVLAVVLLSPAVAFAGSAATNAALGLGAFAVFNQMLGGVGLFGGLAPAAYAAPDRRPCTRHPPSCTPRHGWSTRLSLQRSGLLPSSCSGRSS